MKDNCLLTRLSLWWLRHHQECIDFWPRFCWTLSIAIFIIGLFNGFGLVEVAWFMLVFNLIINLGVYCGIRTMSATLNTLTGEKKEEAHELMIDIVNRRIDREDQDGKVHSDQNTKWCNRR